MKSGGAAQIGPRVEGFESDARRTADVVGEARRTARWRLAGVCGLTVAAAVTASLTFSGFCGAVRAQIVEDAPVRHINVTLNKSKTLTFKAPFTTAVIGSPDIADLLPMTDHTLYVQGKKVGTTNISVFGADKRLVAVVDLEVTLDAATLHSKIAASTGSGNIAVASANGEVVLSGEASDAVSAARAVDVAKALSPRDPSGNGAPVDQRHAGRADPAGDAEGALSRGRPHGGPRSRRELLRRQQERARRFGARRGFEIADRRRRRHHGNVSDRRPDLRRHRWPRPSASTDPSLQATNGGAISPAPSFPCSAASLPARRPAPRRSARCWRK